MDVAALSNEELVERLKALHSDSNRLLARQLVLLGEIEARRLYRELACTSMGDFCQQVLNLSEGATARRLAAARAIRRFPQILARVEQGELHLTALALVSTVLTETNVDAIIADIIGKTTRQVEHLVACLLPRPDVPTTVERLELRRESTTPWFRGGASESEGMVGGGLPLPGMTPDPATGVEGVRTSPLSADRFRVTFTAPRELVAKLERIVELTRHRNPKGDLGLALEAAVTLYLEKVEKELLGKAGRAKKPSAATPKGRRPSRAIRREVLERDGFQCTYVDDSGKRCSARSWLELDHIEPAAHGGTVAASNLRTRCRTHNQMTAEETFGKEHISRKIEERRERSSSGGSSKGAEKKNAPSGGIPEGAANSAAEGGGGGGGNSVTASANLSAAVSSSPEIRPSSGGSVRGLRATKGARAAHASPSRRTGS
ncbi:MAG: HNH endonuclease [Deltaproteobacteria bacterium]|nr:HNH endonuclease [Deltaproteobacteria bacterium]